MVIKLVEVSHKHVLKKINVSIPNLIYGLLGKETSGKTTLLKIIAGLIKPSKGEVIFESEGSSGPNHQRQRIVFIPHNYGLFEDLTVRENITFALNSSLIKEKKNVKEELLKKLIGSFNLKGLEGKKIRDINRVNKLKVALARAVAANPSAILLDEPLKGFPAYLKRTYLLKMKKLFSWLKKPVVYATTDFEEVAYLASNIAILYKGEIILEGPPFLVKRKPKNEEIAEILGIKNLFKCEINQVKTNSLMLKCGGCRIKVNLGETVAENFPLREGEEILIGLPSEDVDIAEIAPTITGQNILEGKIVSISYVDPLFEVIVETEIGNVVSLVPAIKIFEKKLRPHMNVSAIFSYSSPIPIKTI